MRFALDHNTHNKSTFTGSRCFINQLKALEDNAAEYGISHWGLGKMELYT
jgi:3-isopropylmalate/(R)-2-methylmalate dehydratase large subunit